MALEDILQTRRVATTKVATTKAKPLRVVGKAAEVLETAKYTTADFPIVGIGASSGGLEALYELAGNTLKHAFPDDRDGEVTVGLKHDASTDTVCLWVHDNGVGIPDGFDWRHARSLGLRLVQLLTGQLRGTVETETGPGTGFRVTFPLKGFQA